MTRNEAIMLLDPHGDFILTPDCPVQNVRAAFASAVRAVHPDTADIITNGSDHPSVSQLKLARDLLIDEIENHGTKCPICKGKGCVKGRIGVTSCQRCEGTGRL